jgi:RimJ/RimL family protein N-acetyltransferase
MDGDLATGNAPMVPNLVGRRLELGPPRRDLRPRYQRWLNDPEVIVPLGDLLQPVSAEAEAATYRQTSTGEQQAWFTVYERRTGRPLGIAGLHRSEPGAGTAEFVIFLGAKDCWGQGYGAEATRLILEYAFEAGGLTSVLLRVYRFNQRARRGYRRAGFQVIGVQRQAHRVAGVAHDVSFMECRR